MSTISLSFHLTRADPETFQSNEILIVSDFAVLPADTLDPLVHQWDSEHYTCKFVDIKQSTNCAGRDNAEKLRNCLHDIYNVDPFTYLLLIDLVYPNSSHAVPARVFTPSWEPLIIAWNDYYYANLLGDFDANGNGVYGENLTDMSNAASTQVVVGRLVLDSEKCVQELQSYISADIAYRTERINMQNSFTVYREDSPYNGTVDGWSHPFIENLTRLTTDLGYQMYSNIYNYTDAAAVADALANSSLAYFAGHGNKFVQQVGWYGSSLYDYDGPYLTVDDFRTMQTSEPSVMIFGGCRTGEVYDTSNPDVAQITIGLAPMDYLAIPAVSVIANTGLGAVFGKTHYSVLKSSIAEPLAKAVLDQHIKELLGLSNDKPGFPEYELGAFSYGYFGDPTISLACVPDLAVSGLSTSKTIVAQDYIGTVNLTLACQMYSRIETFNISVYANSTVIYSEPIILATSDQTMSFLWNTTGFRCGNYIISAYVEPLPEELDLSDNNCTCSFAVHVGVPGDISSSSPGVYDKVVNMSDIAYMTMFFNTRPSSVNWNSNADINGDNTVNMRDIAIAVMNFGQHE